MNLLKFNTCGVHCTSKRAIKIAEDILQVAREKLNDTESKTEIEGESDRQTNRERARESQRARNSKVLTDRDTQVERGRRRECKSQAGKGKEIKG